MLKCMAQAKCRADNVYVDIHVPDYLDVMHMFESERELVDVDMCFHSQHLVRELEVSNGGQVQLGR